jgi:lipopolysaccharide heptosyltransferase II
MTPPVEAALQVARAPAAEVGAAVRRVFATQTGGWLGDMVLLSPALRALRSAFPHAHIALQVRPLVGAVMRRCPHIDEVLEWDKEGAERGWRGFAAWRRRLREGAYDAAIVWHPTSVRSALLPWAARIPSRVGHAGAGRSPFLTATRPDAPAHETTRYLRVLGLLGVPDEALQDGRTSFWHGPGDRLFAARFFADRNLDGAAPVVGINLGTTWPTKVWPLENYAHIVVRLVAAGGRVLLTGSRAELRQRDAFALAVERTPFADAVGACDVFQTAALIERCDAYLSPDSAPMHIAAAVGTRVVALFGPTSPLRHGPVGTPRRGEHVTLETALPCRPCYHRACRLRRDLVACMRRITPDDALEALRRWL